MELIEFKDEVWETLRTIMGQMDSLFGECYESSGITAGQARILILLSREKEISLTGLSQILRVMPGNLSVMCKRLEQGGLLKRQRDKKDERVVLLSLTGKGEETLCRLRRDLESRCKRVLGEIPEGDLKIMREGMQLMSETLSKAVENNTGRAEKEGVKGNE